LTASFLLSQVPPSSLPAAASTFQFSGEWRVEQNQERAMQIYALAAKPSGWVEKFFVEA